VLTDLVRCCSAFAHTPTSPTSLDSRCSAFGPEPEAPHNGQAIGSGQASEEQHSNERPVGGAKIRHAEEPVPAAGTALSAYYLSPPHGCWRHKLLPSGRQRAMAGPGNNPVQVFRTWLLQYCIAIGSETTFLSALCVIRPPSYFVWSRTFLLGVGLTDLGHFGRYFGQNKELVSVFNGSVVYFDVKRSCSTCQELYFQLFFEKHFDRWMSLRFCAPRSI
jgi:hypothetical protein